MQIANVIVIKDGVVNQNYAFVMKDETTTISDAVENKFWEECQKINPKLPPLDQCDFEGLDNENMPSIDDGYYEHEGTTVCLSWASNI